MLGKIFLVITLLSTLVIMVGLISPKVILTDGVISRGRVIKEQGFVFLVSFCLAVYFSSPSKDGAEAQESVAGAGGSGSVAMKASASSSQAPKDSAGGSDQGDAELSESVRMSKARAADEDRVKKILGDHLGSSMSVAWVNKEKKGEGFSIGMEYAPEAAWSESSYIFSVGQAVISQGKILAKHGVQVDKFRLIAKGPSRDSYGNGSVTKMFTMEIGRDDFKQVNWKEITPGELLEIAGVSFKPIGRKVAASYCEDKGNRTVSPSFCSAVMSGTSKRAMTESVDESSVTGRVDESSPARKGQLDVAKESAGKALKPMNLTFQTFRARVNEDFSKVDMPYLIPESIKPEEDGESAKAVAKIKFNENFFTLVSVDQKSGKVTSILSIIGVSENAFRESMGAIIAASAAAGRNGEKVVGGKIMKLLGSLFKEFREKGGTEDVKESFVQGGVTYSVQISKLLGVWISAESANK